MRKTYVEGNIEVAFGIDRITGFFLQIFKDDEIEIDLDQGLILGNPFGTDEPLTYAKARKIIAEQCPNAISAFEAFVEKVKNEPIGDPLAYKGYVINEKGKYGNYVLLTAIGELQEFVNQLEEGKNILLVDIFDCYVYSNSPQLLNK